MLPCIHADGKDTGTAVPGTKQPLMCLQTCLLQMDYQEMGLSATQEPHPVHDPNRNIGLVEGVFVW